MVCGTASNAQVPDLWSTAPDRRVPARHALYSADRVDAIFTVRFWGTENGYSRAAREVIGRRVLTGCPADMCSVWSTWGVRPCGSG